MSSVDVWVGVWEPDALFLRCQEANIDLNLQSGMLVAVPIPADQAANNREIEDAIQEAIRQAQ